MEISGGGDEGRRTLLNFLQNPGLVLKEVSGEIGLNRHNSLQHTDLRKGAFLQRISYYCSQI
jgi:hypothetical protein